LRLGCCFMLMVRCQQAHAAQAHAALGLYGAGWRGQLQIFVVVGRMGGIRGRTVRLSGGGYGRCC
jgi:hypothetical protein